MQKGDTYMADEREAALARIEDEGDIRLSELVTLPRGERVRRLRAAAVQHRSRPGRPLTHDVIEDFLAGLRSGLCVDDAASLAGCAQSPLYKRRDKDPSFAKAWDIAYAAGSAPLERRVQQIGLTGDAGSMATVRALEIGLRARHGSLAHPRQAAPAATAEMRKHADGSQSFTVSIGSPGAH